MVKKYNVNLCPLIKQGNSDKWTEKRRCKKSTDGICIFHFDSNYLRFGEDRVRRRIYLCLRCYNILGKLAKLLQVKEDKNDWV